MSLYLREIRYTGFRYTDDTPDQPAYVVRFLRDGDVTGETARRDVSVDASTGQPVVTRDCCAASRFSTSVPNSTTPGRRRSSSKAGRSNMRMARSTSRC